MKSYLASALFLFTFLPGLAWGQTIPYCTAGINPNGYVDLSLLPAAPNFPAGGGTSAPIQVNNQPIYNRPVTAGQDFTISRAVRNGTTDSLYVRGLLALRQGNKSPVLGGTAGDAYLGRGLNNTYYQGEISEILVSTGCCRSRKQHPSNLTCGINSALASERMCTWKRSQIRVSGVGHESGFEEGHSRHFDE